MPTIPQSGTWIAQAILWCVSIGVGQSTSLSAESTIPIRTGAARSPLAVQSIDGAGDSDESLVTSWVADVLRSRGDSLLSVPEVEWASVTDTVPLGEEMIGRNLWHAHAPRVTVRRAGGSEVSNIGIHMLFDDRDGRLLVAYTDPKESWVLPMVEADTTGGLGPEERARRLVESVESMQQRELLSSVSDVLGALWGHYNVDVPQAAQIVLRPRRVLRPFPVSNVGPDGIGERNNEVRTYWMVQALGIVAHLTHGTNENYKSQKIFWICDDDLKVSASTFLP